jgi:hypothetical protein
MTWSVSTVPESGSTRRPARTTVTCAVAIEEKAQTNIAKIAFLIVAPPDVKKSRLHMPQRLYDTTESAAMLNRLRTDCRQAFPHQIKEELLVIRPESVADVTATFNSPEQEF